MRPITPIALDGNFKRNDNTIKLSPIAEITSINSKRKWMSNHRAKFINVRSSITSQIPLLSKNFLLSRIFPVLLKEINADIPERNTNAGAQRCVIHRVKNNRGSGSL